MNLHTRSLDVLVVSCLAVTVVSACSAGDVVVARETPEGMDGPCADSRDCSPVAFCAKASCGAAEGQCQPRPVMCDDQPATMCGCDGVNYWNDCLRQQNGIPASSAGECRTQYFPCGGRRGTACPTAGARCAKLGPGGAGICYPDVAGVCWILPPSCPGNDGGPLWQSCGARGPAVCMDVCDAIRSEMPFRLPYGPSCP